MLTVCDDDPGESHSPFVLHGIADDRERVGASFAVRDDVVRAIVVALVDLLSRHECVDVDRVRADQLDGFQLFRLDLDVAAFGEFVTAPLVVFIDGAARLLVHHFLAQPVAVLAIDLVEMDFVRLARGRVEDDRAGHERKLEITLPVCAGRHDVLRMLRRRTTRSGMGFRPSPSVWNYSTPAESISSICGKRA